MTYDNVSVYSEMETTDYVGNKVYKDGLLKMILIDGGYIEDGNYFYYLTDHLGNNRVVNDHQGKIIQKTHYEPFGKAFEEEGDDEVKEKEGQPYLYNGKELYSNMDWICMIIWRGCIILIKMVLIQWIRWQKCSSKHLLTYMPKIIL